ncbi:hypothetical protein A5714_05140 [Mycobacterium sp. E2462]|uniref:DUF5994 family protein n=1 Tax=unclassified Mycobacterium TaxID=2642494 RepID=UPI0007FEFE54|nr:MULTISPECIES: DUF5994 family protein [unclassified Mycobacterium]OBG73568.1 hypothetical protein A5700_06620 [Mycobacterium sp. E1214]OBH22602.1 hypothetical protein A5693_13215 [Mycobacterium sp. E1319]OBI02609.1 hypothetical protein A5714_05140 [Mycobacterium sp. E2462]
MTIPLRGWHPANPVRFSLARELGGDIDGAWWPRADRIANELPGLIAGLTPRLGEISAISVNWSPLQRPPDFNWPGWEQRPQHVMTFDGSAERVNLLVVSYATHSGLALMVLRCAAGLHVEAADRTKAVYLTADSILHVARRQRSRARESGAAQ